ncbi:hypothetical protein BDW75DRAFT_198042 [Aspergillus navahoensis]
MFSIISPLTRYLSNRAAMRGNLECEERCLLCTVRRYTAPAAPLNATSRSPQRSRL